MRNVNLCNTIFLEGTTLGFILTMRNVNNGIYESFNQDDQVLY